VSTDPKARATEMVSALSGEDPPKRVSAEDLFPLVYDELRRLARSYMLWERSGHTLQPTALVHEAYLRLVDQTLVDWKGRTHFFGVGAQVMRRRLVEHARQRLALKRGAGWATVTLTEIPEKLGRGDLGPAHVAEAIQYRALDRRLV